MPHLIITYGPSGSGKGYALPKYTQALSELYPGDPLVDPFIAEIDTLVETDPRFQSLATQIICSFIEDNKVEVEDLALFRQHLTDIVEDADVIRPLSKRLTSAYMMVRRDHDVRLDVALLAAIRDNQNIIFESTGKQRNPLDWLLPLVPLDKYIVSIVFPVVKPLDIIRRAKERLVNRILAWHKCLQRCTSLHAKQKFGQAIRCIEAERNVPVPRMPDVDDLQESIQESQANLAPYFHNAKVRHIFMFGTDNVHRDDFWFDAKDPDAKITPATWHSIPLVLRNAMR